MFNIIKGLTKAAVGVVTLPVDIAADAFTLGGTLRENPRKGSFIANKLSKIMDGLDEATD